MSVDDVEDGRLTLDDPPQGRCMTLKREPDTRTPPRWLSPPCTRPRGHDGDHAAWGVLQIGRLLDRWER